MTNDIFGEPLEWKGHKFNWCDLCDCYSISCPNANVEPKCFGTSCNGGGCDVCSPIFEEFHRIKNHPTQYLTEDEIKVYHKINYLKGFISDMLVAGQTEIDFKMLEANGEFSRHSRSFFEKELQ